MAPRDDQSQQLDGLAQAHVVGEAAAPLELMQELQPAEALALIGAQRAVEAGGLRVGLDPGEARQPRAGCAERRVALGLGQRREQGVDQTQLRLGETHALAAHVRECQPTFVPGKPVFRQYAERAVVEAHELLAAPGRGEQGR